jgi:hypothetical protein
MEGRSIAHSYAHGAAACMCVACCELALSSLHARLDKILSFVELTYPFCASMNNCEDPHDTHRCLRAKSKREREREREL